MVDLSQLAFDNQMLSSHKGVLGPAAGGELSWAELPGAPVRAPCLGPRGRPWHGLGRQEGPERLA